jgi:tetratricopeptide (TPR) repeat protein
VARVALSQRPIGRRMVAESLPVDAAAAPGGGRGRRETGRTLYRRALDMMRRKRNREALAAVRQALKLDRDRPEYLALCAWLLHLEQGAPAMREAMELVERAVRRAPRNTRALYYKGLLLERSDRGEEAQRCYGRVLELDPDDLDAARRLRLLGMRAGRQPQTRGLFARLRER